MDIKRPNLEDFVPTGLDYSLSKHYALDESGVLATPNWFEASNEIEKMPSYIKFPSLSELLKAYENLSNRYPYYLDVIKNSVRDGYERTSTILVFPDRYGNLTHKVEPLPRYGRKPLHLINPKPSKVKGKLIECEKTVEIENLPVNGFLTTDIEELNLRKDTKLMIDLKNSEERIINLVRSNWSFAPEGSRYILGLSPEKKASHICIRFLGTIPKIEDFI